MHIDTELIMTPYVVNIDVDTLNTEFIRSLPITPNDQTCNPAWLSLALQDPSKAELIRTTALELQDQGFLAILSRLVRRVFPTLPSKANYHRPCISAKETSI